MNWWFCGASTVPPTEPLSALFSLPQLSGGLLAAADRREGVTLYRYYEPEAAAEAPAPQPEQRGRLARRYRLAPPAVGELRHRLGLAPNQNLREGVRGGDGKEHGAAGQGKELEEDLEPGFTVLAADACCRPAVGVLVIPAAASPADPGSSSSSSSAAAVQPAAAAAAAAVLDAHGELRLLQQPWPGREPMLQQRCRFLLREPAVALLPGSLGYAREAAGGGAPFGAAAPGAAAAQPVDCILDAELLQQFLLLPPAEQRAVVAGMGGAGAAVGSERGAAELRRAAQRLNNLVASLLL